MTTGPMCSHLVVWDGMGRIEPRPCKRPATRGTPYCGHHAYVAKKRPRVDVREGGFCVGCAQPARSYVVEGVTIALCGRHAEALERAIREGRG